MMPLQGAYDPLLVTLSVLVAILASYTALDLAGRVTAAHGRVRLAWLGGGSLAMGIGIWSMHFIGMLAFRLPVPMSYDVPLWLLSVAVAVAASALALSVVGREAVGSRALLVSALLMGAAIAGMHYIGMAAMRIPGRIEYDPVLVVLSVAIAIAASFAALWLAFRLRREESRRGQWLKAGSATVMGLAIAGMHYTGMAAAQFASARDGVRVQGDHLLATDGLAVSVVIGTLIILGVALLGAMIDRRLRARGVEAEAVRRSEARFRSLVLATSQIVWTTPPSGEFETEQPAWNEFTGQTFEEARGRGWLDAIHPEDHAETVAGWSCALQARAPYEMEHRVRRHDGEYRHMWVRAVPVLAADGSILEWVGVHTDITDERRAEEERDQALTEVRKIATERDAVLRQITDGVVFADPEGRVRFANEAVRRIHGTVALDIPVEEYARTYQLFTLEGELYSPEELPLARAVQRDETVIGAEWRIRRPDGTERIAQGSAAPVIDEDGGKIGAVLIIHDVTAERELLRELKAERARLREIFMQAPALISVTQGPEHRIVLANPVYERMAGRGALVGKTLREALPELEGQGYFEMRDRVYATGEPHVQNEARVLADLNGDGRLEESFLNFVTQPLLDTDGRAEGVLTFGVDVTEQVRARRLIEEQAAELEAHAEELQHQAMQLEETHVELEMLNDELQRANEVLAERTADAERARDEAEAANRAKSDFLSAMSHELRTPLNAISGYVDLIELGVHGPVTDPQAKALDRVKRNQAYLLTLINDLLNYARIEAGRVEYDITDVPVAEVLSGLDALIEPQVHAAKIDYACGWCDPALRARGDREKIEQILLNLLTNAIKFTPEGGRVRTSCEREEDRVQIQVQDTGRGIPDEMIQKIFDPFIQVDRHKVERSRQGVGLGLSISRDLARGMGGDLTVESVVGQGSTFTLVLPRVDGAMPAPPSPDAANRVQADRRSGTERRNGEDRRAVDSDHGTTVSV